MPKEFKDRYPAIVKKLEDMKGGATFGQLHQLRSMLRQDIDPYDLTPGVKSGSYNHFIGKINEVLFDKGAPPELQQAAKLLRNADDFYAKNIAKFKTQSAKWIAEQLEAGVPADPAALARQIMRPGQTEEMRTIRKVVGKPLWSAVQAADTKEMLEQSKTLIPGETDGMRFAEQVLQRDRDGILEGAYDPKTAETLRQQARRVLMLKGKIPIETREGDTVSTLLRRADAIASEIKKQAEADPVRMLSDELKKFDREVGKIKGQYQRQRRANPLSFLENQSAGAIESANRILNKPDLILAVARQYGEQSPEFEMMRQVWATRLFQRTLGDTSKLAGEFAEKIPPEVQQLMFPGVTMDNAQTLAKDMAFLLPHGDSDAGRLDGGGIPRVEPALKLAQHSGEGVGASAGSQYGWPSRAGQVLFDDDMGGHAPGLREVHRRGPQGHAGDARFRAARVHQVLRRLAHQEYGCSRGRRGRNSGAVSERHPPETPRGDGHTGPCHGQGSQ